MKERIRMTDGDVYFWRWKDYSRHVNDIPFGSYHCYSRIAVVKDGKLVDTFWSSLSDNSTLNQDAIIATFQGNINDMKVIYPGEVDYYVREDVVDMRHSNNQNAKIYVKPGAERNATAMLDVVEYEIGQRSRDILSAQRDIEHLERAKQEIEAGNLNELYIPVLR